MSRRALGIRIATTALLCVAAGLGATMASLLASVFSTEIVGAPSIGDDWIALSKPSISNRMGLLSRDEISELLLRSVGVDHLFWSARRLPVASHDVEYPGSVHFVSERYFGHGGVETGAVPGSPHLDHILQLDESSAIITETAAQKLGISPPDLPEPISIGGRAFQVRGVVARGFRGYGSEPADVFVRESLFEKVIFADKPPPPDVPLPVFRVLVADHQGTFRAMVSGGNDDRLRSFRAYAGGYPSPDAAAEAHRVAGAGVLFCVVIFGVAVLGHAALALLSSPSMGREAAIRAVLGESLRVRWTCALKRGAIDAAWVSAGAVLVGWLAASYLLSSELFKFSGVHRSSILGATSIFCLIAAIIAAAAKEGIAFSVTYKNTAHPAGSLSGRSPVLAPARTTLTGMVTFSVLSGIVAGSALLGLANIDRQGFGFVSSDVVIAKFARGLPAVSAEQGRDTIRAAEEVAADTNVRFATSSCKPHAAEDSITLADMPSQRQGSISICHVSPEFFDVLRIPLQQGRTFTHDEQYSVVVTTDFLEAVGGGISVGSKVLREALGADYTIIGLVDPIKLSGMNVGQVPTVVVNGSLFGFRNYGLVRAQTQARAEYFLDRLDADHGQTLLERDTVARVEDALAWSIRVPVLQRNIAVAGSFAAFLLCALTYVAALSLFARATKSELAVRVALGATPFRIAVRLVQYAGLPVLIGSIFAAFVAPFFIPYVTMIGAGPLSGSDLAVAMFIPFMFGSVFAVLLVLPVGKQTWQNLRLSELLSG